MKKLIFLTAVTMLLASAGGCRCWNSLWRGPHFSGGSETAVFDPCAPVASCDPCAACNGAPGTLAPAPTTTYVPGPVN